MNYYILCFLVASTLGQNAFRLSTKTKQILTPQDTLTSTLGYFRTRLIKSTCQLRVQAYNDGQYIIKGYYPQEIFKIPCSYIKIQHTKLVTQNQVILFLLKNTQYQFSQTTFTIDDLGVMRLTSYDNNIRDQFSTPAQEVWFSLFRTPSSLLYATSSFSVTNQDTLPLVVNLRGWGFSSKNGQFRIFHTDDPRKIVRYKYTSFSITPGQIYDQLNHELPTANFPGVNFQQRCGSIRYMNYKFPLVFKLSKYWPQLRVLDQGGYELLSIRYPSYNCITELGINVIEGVPECLSWFCPQNTFQHQGDCVLNCPSPFFHLINRNGRNKCVLMCEEGSKVSQQRVCLCNAVQLDHQCNQLSHFYLLGCYCDKDLYYNGIKCTNFCPLGYKQLSLNITQKQDKASRIDRVGIGGICAKCPYKCLKCNKAYTQIETYLVCKQCFPGYSLFGNVCKKQCSDNAVKLNDTNTFNQAIDCSTNCKIEQCQKCVIQNRYANNDTVTMQSKQMCTQCARPFALHKNFCLKKCPSGFIIKATQSFHFICEPISNCQSLNSITKNEQNKVLSQCLQCSYLSNICWIDCEKGSYFNNQSQCFCIKAYDHDKNDYQYGYVQHCNQANQSYQLKQKECPWSTYLYRLTNECLQCPFGCATCVSDVFGFIECTSCGPSYFLMIDINWTHFCQRDTTLTSCQQGNQKIYDSQNKICGYKNNSQLAYLTRPQRVRCQSLIKNCLTCLYQSSTVCTFCGNKTYLYNGTCFASCPQSTFQYQQICIKNQISNCQVTKVTQLYYLTTISQNSINLQGYDYFLPAAFSRLNKVIDPIGSVFLYANVYGKSIGTRVSAYPYPVLQCLKCQQTYGINLFNNIYGDEQICVSCLVKHCSRCPNNLQQICYECSINYKISLNGAACTEKSQEQKSCTQGNWRNQKYLCVDECTGYDVNDRGIINCSNFCNSGSIIRSQASTPKLKYLLCRKPSLQQNKQQNIILASTHFEIGGMTMIVFSAVNGQLQYQDISSPDFVSLYTISQNNNSKALSQIKVQDKIQYSLQNNKIIIICNFSIKDISMLIVVFKSKTIFMNSSTSKSQSTSDLATLKSSSQTNIDDFLYLSQTKYVLTTQYPKYMNSFRHCLIISGYFITILSLVITLLFISQQITYKTDNLIILLQTTVLTFYSLNVHLIDDTFYYFMIGFTESVEISISKPLGMSLLSKIDKEYIQYSFTSAQSLVLMDSNAIRQCFGTLMIIISYGFFYLCLGVFCMRTQIGVFWKRTALHKQLQLEQQKQHSQTFQQTNNLIKQVSHLNMPQITPVVTRKYQQQEIYRQIQAQSIHSDLSKYIKKAENKKEALATTIANTSSFPVNCTVVKQSQYNYIEVTQNKGSVKQSIRRIVQPLKQFLKYQYIDIDHSKKLYLFFVFLLQNYSLSMVYFSICTIQSSVAHSTSISGNARTASLIFSYLLLAFISIYAIARVRVNRIAGIYMIKRISYATILGFINGRSIRLLYLALVQAIFLILRIFFQQIPFLVTLNQPKINNNEQDVKISNTNTKNKNKQRKRGKDVQHFDDKNKNAMNKNMQNMKKQAKSNFNFRLLQRIKKSKVSNTNSFDKNTKNINNNQISGNRQVFTSFFGCLCIKRTIFWLVIEQLSLIVVVILYSLLDISYAKSTVNTKQAILQYDWIISSCVIITTILICCYLYFFCIQLVELYEQYLNETNIRSSHRKTQNQKISQIVNTFHSNQIFKQINYQQVNTAQTCIQFLNEINYYYPQQQIALGKKKEVQT